MSFPGLRLLAAKIPPRWEDATPAWMSDAIASRVRVLQQSERAKGLELAAEQLLAQHRLGPRSVVLRMAGLYGPGRLPSLEALRTGEPIAAYINYAMHAINGYVSGVVSADYPGAMCRYVEKAFDDKMIVAFTQGASAGGRCGDERPRQAADDRRR